MRRLLAQKVWVGPRKLHFGKPSEDSDARGPQTTLWDTQVQCFRVGCFHVWVGQWHVLGVLYPYKARRGAVSVQSQQDRVWAGGSRGPRF